VLLAVDGSDAAVRAAQSVASLVCADDAEVHLLVVLSYTLYPYVDDAATRADLEKAANEAQVAASEKAALALEQSGHRVTVVRRFGHPTDEIITEIEDWEPDLVVLGRRGLRGAKAWLGSVSEHVLHHTKVPVLLVP